MAQVAWSPSSLRDLDAIADFIARDSSHYAGLFVQNIVARVARVERLADFPLSGRIVPEYGLEDLREFLFENYRIVYRVRGDLVEVSAVIHGARNLPESPLWSARSRANRSPSWVVHLAGPLAVAAS